MKNPKHISGVAAIVFLVILAMGVSSCKTVVRRVAKNARAEREERQRAAKKHREELSRIGADIKERLNRAKHTPRLKRETLKQRSRREAGDILDKLGTKIKENRQEKPKSEAEKMLDRLKQSIEKNRKDDMKALKKGREKHRRAMERYREVTGRNVEVSPGRNNNP